MYCWKENILDMILEQGTSWSFQSITNFLFETSNFVNLQKFCFLFLMFEKKKIAKCTEEGSYWYWESLRDDEISATYKEAHLTKNTKKS